jgi:hypothetical protein
MGMKFTNNATTTLAAGITNVATSLTVATGAGALFPAAGGANYFWCTLANLAGAVEIVKCTTRAGDVLTVTRAQDGTAAVAWNTGDKVELRLVAAVLNDIPKLDESNLFTAPQALPVGAVGTPSLYLGANTTTGLYNIGANHDGYAVSGAKVLDIASTGLGVTGAISASTTLAVTGASTLTGGIVGVTDGSSAAAGMVGEVFKSVAGLTSFPADNVYGDVTSLNLTAGRWSIDSNANFFMNSSTTTQAVIGISTTSGNSGTGLVSGDNFAYIGQTLSSGYGSAAISGYVLNLAAPATVYMKMWARLSAGTPKLDGAKIIARRF